MLSDKALYEQDMQRQDYWRYRDEGQDDYYQQSEYSEESQLMDKEEAACMNAENRILTQS